MPRAARLFELLELLTSAATRTVPDLAGRLEVDERTVRRDIETLRELGVPVQSTRGRYGGYRIGAGYRMPPLMLDDSEAIAVLVGLVLTAAAGDGPIDASALATATAKVRRVLPHRLTERADALLDVVVFGRGEVRAGTVGVDPEILLIVAGAVRDRRPLALMYRDRNGRMSSRSVQPHDVVVHAGRWYLSGLDASSRDMRDFRVDRIETATVLGGTFPAPTTHDAVADLKARFARADYRHRVVLRVNASEAEVRRHLSSAIAEIEPVIDGWLRLTIAAESLTWLPSVLLAIDAEIIVERPDDLRTQLATAAQRLQRMAGAES